MEGVEKGALSLVSYRNVDGNFFATTVLTGSAPATAFKSRGEGVALRLVAVMRRLIYVPIVHSEADFGSLTHSLRKRYIDRFGLSNWRERIKSIDALWQEIRRRVLALEIDFHKLKVYQDGLPICGRELEIVRELARQGSKNHRLLVELVERGALIMGTEDAQLLVEEYLRLRDGLEGDGGTRDRVSPPAGARAGSVEDTLSCRDLYIAKRIRETLGEGELGLLFIGLLHRVDEKLNQDMEVTYL
ncbi:MAG: hypothetical protein HYY45_03100 [Deltaproteobacteria bacterium]|nr:hypothetical protein [Deltaproteobacteria bacterium]